MSVEIKLTFASLELAITAMAAVRAAENKPDVVAKAADAPKPPKADAKAKTADAGSSHTAGTAKTDAPAPPPPVSPPPADAYKPIGEAIAKKVAEGHKGLAVALLAKFGAKSGKELKPEQYEAFAKELAELGMEPDIS